jgi:uncharacterized protein (TIGR03086 family)
MSDVTDMLDLGPAARRMSDLLAAVPDDRLAVPTPCAEYTLGELIDHIGGLAIGFAATARKDVRPSTSGGSAQDAGHRRPDWRDRIHADLIAMAEAWRDPAAWQGMSQAGGVDLPGAVLGSVALNELVVHGWDVARSIGRPYDCADWEVDGCLRFVAEVATTDPDAGPYGAVVEVPADASPLDRLVALTGRDPEWRSPTLR